MDNIYGQTEEERYSAASLPPGFAENAGNILYSWLGSLWRGLHEGDDMVQGLQKVRGIRLAQLYLDVLEAAKLKDRNGAPVFHREIWHPMALRRLRRDMSQENMLKAGIDGEIGRQPEGSIYGEGVMFIMGKMANYADYVTYPIDSGIAGGALSIVDNIVNPGVVLNRVDSLPRNPGEFQIRNGSIIFRREDDPLSPGSAFERYDITSDNPDRPDMESVLWASDVFIDKNYVSDHISYALGARAPSTDIVKRIVNAAWSSVASGLTPELIRTLIAAMLNIPVIQHERETVVDMSVEDETGATIVHTDMGAYRVSPKAKLRSDVKSGSVMRRGDLLDESLRVYPFLNGVSCDVSSDGHGNIMSIYYDDMGFSVPLEQDVPSVTLPSGLIRARTEHGVYAMWDASEIKAKVDSLGRRRLYFDIGGSRGDVEAFWDDIWRRADSDGVNLEDVIGREGDMVSPAAFVLRNLVGANTMFVVVDASQIDDVSMMHDPMFFDMLSSVVPSAIRLFLVEHRPAGEDDKADLGDAGEDTFLAAALPDPFESSEGQGELVSMRLIRPSPAKIKGSKEEE